jgi:hypothetical protein
MHIFVALGGFAHYIALRRYLNFRLEHGCPHVDLHVPEKLLILNIR